MRKIFINPIFRFIKKKNSKEIKLYDKTAFVEDRSDCTYKGITLKTLLLLLFFIVGFSILIPFSSDKILLIVFLCSSIVLGMISLLLSLKKTSLSNIMSIIFSLWEGAFFGSICFLLGVTNEVFFGIFGVLLSAFLILLFTLIVFNFKILSHKFKILRYGILFCIIYLALGVFAFVFIIVVFELLGIDSVQYQNTIASAFCSFEIATLFFSFLILQDFKYSLSYIKKHLNKECEWQMALGFVFSIFYSIIKIPFSIIQIWSFFIDIYQDNDYYWYIMNRVINIYF